MKTILNKKLNVDPTKQPLFFGQDLSLQRYDKFRYQIFFDLYKNQMQFNWRPQQIDLKKDRVDYNTLTQNQKFIFTANLKYQTLMDSIIARGLRTLTEHITNLQLQACCVQWSRFQILHSYSYTYIIKNVYSDTSQIFDSILPDDSIMVRAESVAKQYDLLKDCTGDLKSQIYLTLISINILQAIRFYVSFACTFAFAQGKRMIGNADIVKLIQRDQKLHLQITQNLIKILRDNKEQGFQQTVAKNQKNAVQMFKHAVDQQKAWAKYLFKDGALLGLNQQLVCEYIEYLANVRMKAIGLPVVYPSRKNPLGWLKGWQDSTGLQVAPQESEILSYKIGASKNDVADINIDDLDL